MDIDNQQIQQQQTELSELALSTIKQVKGRHYKSGDRHHQIVRNQYSTASFGKSCISLNYYTYVLIDQDPFNQPELINTQARLFKSFILPFLDCVGKSCSCSFFFTLHVLPSSCW